MVREGLDLWLPAVEFMLRAEYKYIKVSFPRTNQKIVLDKPASRQGPECSRASCAP